MSEAVLSVLALRTDYMIGNKQTKIGFTLHLLRGNKKATSRHIRKGAGFTLIELIVAAAIFILVITVAVSLLTSALRVQRRAIAVQNVQDNGRYLMDFIAKEIRMSKIRTFDGQTTVLNISHPINGDIKYTFTGTAITRNDEKINSDEVEVSGKFLVDGRTPGDDEQVRVTVVMKVKAVGVKIEEKTDIDLQTTFSQRSLY